MNFLGSGLVSFGGVDIFFTGTGTFLGGITGPEPLVDLFSGSGAFLIGTGDLVDFFSIFGGVTTLGFYADFYYNFSILFSANLFTLSTIFVPRVCLVSATTTGAVRGTSGLDLGILTVFAFAF